MFELSIIGLALIIMGSFEHIQGVITRKYDHGVPAFIFHTLGWLVLITSLYGVQFPK